MASAVTLSLTILDLPEILEILNEAVNAVPSWEREPLVERLNAVLARARRERRRIR